MTVRRQRYNKGGGSNKKGKLLVLAARLGQTICKRAVLEGYA
jgi:hypothetical protein